MQSSKAAKQCSTMLWKFDLKGAPLWSLASCMLCSTCKAHARQRNRLMWIDKGRNGVLLSLLSTVKSDETRHDIWRCLSSCCTTWPWNHKPGSDSRLNVNVYCFRFSAFLSACLPRGLRWFDLRRTCHLWRFNWSSSQRSSRGRTEACCERIFLTQQTRKRFSPSHFQEVLVILTC